jgi:hypothetical protein
MSWSISVVGKPESVAKRLTDYQSEPDSLDNPAEKKIKAAAVSCAIDVANAAVEGSQAIEANLNGHAYGTIQNFNISIKTISNFVE